MVHNYLRAAYSIYIFSQSNIIGKKTRIGHQNTLLFILLTNPPWSHNRCQIYIYINVYNLPLSALSFRVRTDAQDAPSPQSTTDISYVGPVKVKELSFDRLETTSPKTVINTIHFSILEQNISKPFHTCLAWHRHQVHICNNLLNMMYWLTCCWREIWVWPTFFTRRN